MNNKKNLENLNKTTLPSQNKITDLNEIYKILHKACNSKGDLKIWICIKPLYDNVDDFISALGHQGHHAYIIFKSDKFRVIEYGTSLNDGNKGHYGITVKDYTNEYCGRLLWKGVYVNFLQKYRDLNKQEWTGYNYDLFLHNCQHFINAITKFKIVTQSDAILHNLNNPLFKVDTILKCMWHIAISSFAGLKGQKINCKNISLHY